MGRSTAPGPFYVERRKRRLRKKLLQIENLEILSRPLNLEEEIKVGKKAQIREELQGLLKGISALGSIKGRGLDGELI